MRAARRPMPRIVVALALLIGGCGAATAQGSTAVSGPSVASVSPTTQATTTAAPSTTATTTTTTTDRAAAPSTPTPTTSAPSTSTTSVPATAAATSSSVLVVLPQPDDPPADANAAEPVVDLGTIEIPSIGLSQQMYEGVTLTTLNRGPGHWPGTALPGQVGNVVVGGHRVSHNRAFRNIDQLRPGDQVIFTTADGRFAYAVTSTEVVLPTAIQIIDQTPDRTATLFACHPPGSTSQRIVVHLALAA